MVVTLLFLWCVVLGVAQAYRYDPAYVAYNLNTNQTAHSPINYWGSRQSDHAYHPSPGNWRFPFYTVMLDRFVNGNPFNDDINGTLFEKDTQSNQLRHGGDVQGLIDSLDYLHGMGIRGLYLAGSVFMNLPWGYDGYSAIDLSLLDPHFGDLSTWQHAIDEIHARGMYVVLDNTYATLGDLIGFEGYLNTTAPFTTKEHHAQYKTSRQYLDFSFGNEYNETCHYPRFWNETGFPVDASVTEQLVGCYDSEFDQYGDTEAFGVYPDWRRQITKFASVQDRLREWHPPVRKKIERFYCMLIAQLDIDGFRYDKALQSTVDALSDMNHAMRRCAHRHGKDNFFLPGELTGGNDLASVWLGRGRQPDMLPPNLTEAVTAGLSTQDYSIRTPSHHCLDGAAFHYSVYRSLTRFLGMDGNLEAGYDTPLNFVDLWNTLLLTNDMVNANTGEFDPRHMFGSMNQDLVRWPAVRNGIQRQLLANFITIMTLPGIPLLLWGEEQAFYVLDNVASNYIFGRQPLSAASAWQTHGCYALDSTQYYQFPVESARVGCHDDTVSYDHRDPSAPVRNILKHMFHLRDSIPVLNDGAWLQQLSNQTWEVIYPGSSGVVTETGMWSVLRSGVPGVQNFTTNSTETDHANDPIWLLYSNVNVTTDYQFNCSDATPAPLTTALLAPFDAGTRVQNLLAPFEIIELQNSSQYLHLNGSSNASSGCLSSLTFDTYGFKAFVPVANWVQPEPVVTRFIVNGDLNNGHDARILSAERVAVEIQFSAELDCATITDSILLAATTVSGRPALLNATSASCGSVTLSEQQLQVLPPNNITTLPLQAKIPSVWSWSAELYGVEDGIHQISVVNASTAVDRFLFRIGQADNPVVFPRTANYSSSLVQTSDNPDELLLNHAAAGADLWRYTTNWGSSFSTWMPYTGEQSIIERLAWTGTGKQAWKGDHVRVQYFSSMAGTSDIIQEGDVDSNSRARRFPHLYWDGPYNEFGYDAGIENEFEQVGNNTWRFDFMTEWPALAQVNVWGINPDGNPDQSYVMGDIDQDSILDRMPPSSLQPAIINITAAPVQSFLAWTVTIDDATRHFQLTPAGSSKQQMALFLLLATMPLVFAIAAVMAFMKIFYRVKLNQVGITEKSLSSSPSLPSSLSASSVRQRALSLCWKGPHSRIESFQQGLHRRSSLVSGVEEDKRPRRTVLIGTMEYDIEDWKIKVKIGGLGVMAQLMGKALEHQDLIWVIPCIGGVDYPIDTPAEPMKVTILGTDYSVQVQYHQFKNIKYVLLDAPVFRQQTQAEPYPARMDDMASAIYYSAWNQCIAQAVRRFPIDLYHINDYHGCIAPLYLLPHSIPVCLSLHNAEFQGLWPMRTPDECAEVCEIFNLTQDVVSKFVQFGQVFNLLYAGASYLRVFQVGFGAVGVSKKYGRRAYLRYPIFWGLHRIGQLPNPDPSDTAEWDRKLVRAQDIQVDPEFEAARPALRVEAQKWAGLEEDASAELFVFVGRWSTQKGIDLIADVFPTILKRHPKTQLICVGPVIDLYGKFAALKLDKLMKQYPKRVFSRPVFTALPPCIFSGAEFALIPSRDEPFGLVAVEFGRKGALGVGARVGGLGNMPGWWYTIEAITTTHLTHQFHQAIEDALASKPKQRASMRARSAKQRFPVAQWVEDLDILQTTSIRLHKRIGRRISRQPANSTASLPAPPAPLAEVIEELLPETPGASTPGPSSPGLSSSSSGSSASAIASTPPPFISLRPTAVSTPTGSIPATPDALPRPSGTTTPACYFSDASLLAADCVTGGKKDYMLQQVDRSFTDSQGVYFKKFEEALDKGNLANTCVEEYLMKSEKEWFQLYLNAKLGRDESTGNDSNGATTPRPQSRNGKSRNSSSKTPAASTMNEVEKQEQNRPDPDGKFEDFLLGEDYNAPRYLRKWLQLRMGDWPVYSLLLALGQIMAANSYQLTLLTGEVGEAATRVYVLCGIYMVASALFWLAYRRLQSVTVLTIPFVLYGIAFLTIGLARFGPTIDARGWIQNLATGCYTAASASGSLYFSLNFGDEGGSTVRSWVFRACIIQGLQQAYVTALWYWGAHLNNQSASQHPLTLNSNTVTAICIPIAVALWLVAFVVYIGMPDYYRRVPGSIASFYTSALRRKIIVWFFFTVIIQNFFLSSQYGRSWRFLWSSQHAQAWQVACLVIFFFIILWIVLCWCFSHLSRSHSWLLSILAVGLGAPRWAQIWWGVSGMGAWLPWTGGAVASALVSRSLWLWLGVLDTVQSVGIGIILLSTMTRVHVAFTLVTAQVIGAAFTAISRAAAPNKLGPGPIFPNIVLDIDSAFNAWFWLGLVLNCGVCVGFFLFFRKEQLNKP